MSLFVISLSWVSVGVFTCLSLSVPVSPSVTLRGCVYLCVCVPLQEAELAARILLDRGQVTAWVLPGWEGLSLSPVGGGPPPGSSWLSTPFLPIPGLSLSICPLPSFPLRP